MLLASWISCGEQLLEKEGDCKLVNFREWWVYYMSNMSGRRPPNKE